MTQHEIAAKFEQAIQDEAFAQELFSVETPEAAQAVLASQGIEMSIEDVTALGKAIAEDGEDELSEEQLEDVAGGFGVLNRFPHAYFANLRKKLSLFQKIENFSKLW